MFTENYTIYPQDTFFTALLLFVFFLRCVQQNCSLLKADVTLGLQQHAGTRIGTSWLKQRNRIISIQVPLHDTATWVKKNKTKTRQNKTELG